MTNLPDLDESELLGTVGGHAGDPLRDAKLSRRASRLGLVAVVACPCHLPLIATVLALVGFGGTAAALRDNLMAVGVILGFVAVVSLGLAIASSRAARACRLPLPPAFADGDPRRGSDPRR